MKSRVELLLPAAIFNVEETTSPALLFEYVELLLPVPMFHVKETTSPAMLSEYLEFFPTVNSAI